MDEMLQWVSRRLQEDLSLEKVLVKLLKGRPKGSLHVSMNHRNPRYYWINDGKRIYLGKDRSELAKSLVEKDYYQRLLQKTRAEIRVLKHFQTGFDPNALVRVFTDLHRERKALLDPLVLPDELFVEGWLEEGLRKREARGNTYPKPFGFTTSGGDAVRSKSEVILVEAARQLGIPYIYECPLELENEVVFPDLTLLNVRLRKTVYLEHFGAMYAPEYAAAAVRKIYTYERFGIFPGDRLLLTMESSQNPLDIETARSLFQKFLL